MNKTPRPQAPAAEVSSRLARHRVELVNQTGGRKVLGSVKDAVQQALTLESPEKAAEVCVVVAHDPDLHKANWQFRGIDEATDVLSFPAPANPAGHIGDVMLSWDFAVAQAARRGVRPVDEAAMLAVHGVLHLLGYDDMTEADRSVMLSRMNSVMAAAGLPQEPEWASLPHGEGDAHGR